MTQANAVHHAQAAVRREPIPPELAIRASAAILNEIANAMGRGVMLGDILNTINALKPREQANASSNA